MNTCSPKGDENIANKEEQSLRPIGLCAGEFTVPDDFNDPLPEDILRAFEGDRNKRTGNGRNQDLGN